MLVPKNGREGVPVLETGFHDFPCQSLSDLDGLGDAAAFGYQSRDVRAGGKVAAVFNLFHPDANGGFFYLREVFLAFHPVTRSTLYQGLFVSKG